MTKALQEIFDDLTRLPESEQDAVAALIREELLAERKWEELFGKRADVLEKLAMEAMKEIDAGRTKPLMTNGEFTDD